MCSVVGCDSGRRSAHRFKLPEDPERRLEWVQFLFAVNGQRLKESSWTDITICSEHFTEDCFETPSPATGTVQLKPGVVPSLCLKSEPDEPEPCQKPVETTEVASKCDHVEDGQSRDCPSSYSEESGPTSGAAQESTVSSDSSDDFMSDYGQMLQTIVNIDMIREKAVLLQKRGRYVVNEKRLLQLFSCKCPLCGSKVKVEKVTYGALIVLNQRCLQCDYRHQWKSQVNASVPTSVDQDLAGGVDVTPETQQTVSRDDIVSVVDEESDPTDETEELDDGAMNSDEDWNPTNELSPDYELRGEESDEESECEDDDYPHLAHKHSQLCTDCGMFYNKQRRHTCEHKLKPYSCNICGKRCVSEVALNSHSRIHDADYEHRCKYCHVTFKTRVDKITHEQTHLTEGKPYKCPDCPETFPTNKERGIHLEDHRGPRQLKCDFCGIEFNRGRSLHRHLAVHTGAKPFKCSVCQRGFNQASHLKSHMRLHTGERPYKCQRCDKSFNHNVSLKSHVQRCHSPSSGREQKRKKRDEMEKDTGDAQDNGDKKSTNPGLENVEEQDTEGGVQEERIDVPRKKRRSTGRPIGRPRRNAAGNLAREMKGQRSNTETAKVKARKLKRTRGSEEDSEGEPTESDTTFDLTEEEEEERRERATSSTSRSRGRAKPSDTDSDFKDSKKKRSSGQKRGESSEKRRGRPRKNQVEDT